MNRKFTVADSSRGGIDSCCAHNPKPTSQLPLATRAPERSGARVTNIRRGVDADADAGGDGAAVVIAKQGYAVDVLSRLPWLTSARIVYWGDLDTHGFAILNRFRSYFPRAESILMDETTLLDNRSLWANEPDQNVQSLSLLTEPEQAVLEMLRSSTYGPSVRLEQERIPWDVVEGAFERVLGQ